MPANSLLVIQDEPWDGMDYAYKPSLLGGTLSYWVKMQDMKPGCVAGLYLVALNPACDIESDWRGSTDP